MTRRRSPAKRAGPPPLARPGRRVLFVLFPGCEIMDVAGPLQAFAEAAAFGASYDVRYVGTAERVTSAQGLELAGVGELPEPEPTDRVIVPGYPVLTMRPPPAIVRWLARAARVGAQVCSVCTGAFALGAAGLLDGRRCTTHWRRTAELAERYPRALVVGDRLFVEDGNIVSSAGIASGVDMTLALLERDGGPVLASSVAREMVVYLRRDGGQRQESVYLDYQTHLNPGIHRLQQHLVAHPESRESLAALARIAGCSERHLTRTFRRVTGISINAFRRELRLERAASLMRNPTLTMEAIAAQCGLADARQLRRLWRQRHGRSPRAGAPD